MKFPVLEKEVLAKQTGAKKGKKNEKPRKLRNSKMEAKKKEEDGEARNNESR